ncbi:MAG: hypothetical protein H6736_18035 [Alphaproteobacteria bacterium]|nr:hypothetical protein [Alphaproteobacteria bacterium]
MRRLLPVLLLLAGCASSERDPEAWDDWYGPVGPADEDVVEPIAFTDEPYAYDDFSGAVGGLTPLMQNFTRKFAESEALPPGCDGWQHDTSLPREFWAMVTLHPRLYYKGQGCTPNPQPRDADGAYITSEEKYYGNFFIEDDSGGIFVLNDSKVAHFRMGDRVKIRVNGVGERFKLRSIVSHEILQIDRGPHPIAWTPAGDSSCSGVPSDFDPDDPQQLAAFQAADVTCDYGEYSPFIGRTLRVEGIVLSDPDTFGGFHVYDDEGRIHQVSLDSELNRRKVSWPVGSRIRVTGPVLNSFGHSIIIMKKGQVQLLD